MSNNISDILLVYVNAIICIDVDTFPRICVNPEYLLLVSPIPWIFITFEYTIHPVY